MQAPRQLLKRFNLDAIYCIDFETFYSTEYSLRRMPTTEYIYHPEFELQTAAVQKAGTKTAKVHVGQREFAAWAKTVNWKRTGLLGHHTQFDGLIAWRAAGVVPAMYFDTVSMAKLVMPIQIGGSLKALTEAFGRPGKRHGQALVDVKGRRLKDFTKAELKALKEYNGDDVDDTLFVFEKLLPFVPEEELRLIDLTMKMYCRPTVLLDKPLLESVVKKAVEHKATLMKKSEAERDTLMSNQRFAEALQALGVAPPMKISKTTGEPTLALSKQDAEFKALLQHEDERVAALVAARFGVKSTIVETRAARMAARADYGPQPIYLNYAGAKTLRWSGSDGANWQNLTRGSDMRKAIMAPPGHVFVIADQAQIEARLNAWCSGQTNIVEAFRRGEDVYAIAASSVYGRPINKDDDPLERFIGKVCVLMLQYGAGWERFAEYLRIGAAGPPVDITDRQAKDVHRGWRNSNPHIVANWRRQENALKSAFGGRQSIESGVLTYDGRDGRGFTWGPTGVGIRYDGVEIDDGELSYVAKARRRSDGTMNILRQKLYGGLIVENNTQFLSRVCIGSNMVQLADAMPYWKQVMTTHDEIVGVVPKRYADKALAVVKKTMTTPPAWAPDLPLAVDAHTSTRYDK